MPKIETEIKLRIDALADLEERLRVAGAIPSHRRHFEDNQLYDFPDRALMNKGAMLRVRMVDDAAFLTFKGRARTDGGVKAREEIETTLAPAEAETLHEILRALGMEVVFRYQKYRTTWSGPGVHVTLDETPIGKFLEIEGERAAIDVMAARLGFTPSEYIAASYRDLYLESLASNPGPADRMLFDAHQS